MLLQLSTWQEIEAYLQRSKGIIVPIGSTEQHGPNGLIGTDAICPEVIARGVSKKIGALVAPTISQSLGWQWAPAAAAISCVVRVLAMQPLRAGWDAGRNPAARLRERPFDALTEVWQSPALRWLSVCGFFYAAVQLCLATFVVTLLGLGFATVLVLRWQRQSAADAAPADGPAPSESEKSYLSRVERELESLRR